MIPIPGDHWLLKEKLCCRGTKIVGLIRNTSGKPCSGLNFVSSKGIGADHQQICTQEPLYIQLPQNSGWPIGGHRQTMPPIGADGVKQSCFGIGQDCFCCRTI